MKERLAKFMARTGVCSRRQAEEYILQERVTVNGRIVSTPAFNVSGDEVILFDGEKLPEIEQTSLFLYYKPTGLVTTHKDEKGRTTVFDMLPQNLPRLISVGRLDLNSEGLLLLTNNGELARELELPKNAWSRRYRVRVQAYRYRDRKSGALPKRRELRGTRIETFKKDIGGMIYEKKRRQGKIVL